ncbi:transposase, partial [Sporosarcina sp. YIM B06819]|uniref:RNA-guided endonuclease InsQ/TnpB family protein n=1 Tax=Sporosarcina sp. YIM B06819 TaxID=3081769 RepID=UPI00298D37A6
QAIKDACGAYKKFFNGKAKHPTFKSKRGTVPSFYQDPLKIRFTATHVKVEGFAENKRENKQQLNWIRLVEKERIPHGKGVKYVNPRIRFDGLHWWISVGVIVYTCQEYPKNVGIGIDLGITNLGICSDGTVYPTINKTKKVRKLEKKKRRLQRKVSRKYQYNMEGERYKKTCNIIKSEQQLLTITRRLTNIRQNYLHQITSEIVNRKPRFIVLEDLNVSGMMKNKHLAKAIQQQKFREFRRQAEYKSERNGVQFILVDRWYPSSKLCFHCGQLKKDLKLSERIYICPCGNRIDRDVQAALNLKRYGEKGTMCLQIGM